VLFSVANLSRGDWEKNRPQGKENLKDAFNDKGMIQDLLSPLEKLPTEFKSNPF